MTREELFRLIHERIEQSPYWADISAARTLSQCRNFSTGLYDYLNKPENAIEGLSLAVVNGYGYFTNHAWLIAHHPDAGFFMIDPTASQFLAPKGEKNTPFRDEVSPFKDVFIGTYEELEKMASGENRTYDTRVEFYTIWPPYLVMHSQKEEGKPNRIFYKPEDVEKLWDYYDHKIELESPVWEKLAWKEKEERRQEFYGKWAAQMEEQGLNWRRIIESYHSSPNAGVYPDLDEGFFQRIAQPRNEHIQLGRDQQGMLYTQRLGPKYGGPEDPETLLPDSVKNTHTRWP